MCRYVRRKEEIGCHEREGKPLAHTSECQRPTCVRVPLQRTKRWPHLGCWSILAEGQLGTTYMSLSGIREASMQGWVTGNWLHTEGLTKKVHILKLEGVRFLAFREEHMETEKVRLNPECRRRIEDIDVNSYISIYAEKERQKKKYRYKCLCVEIQNYCRCKCVYVCICTHIFLSSVY